MASKTVRRLVGSALGALLVASVALAPPTPADAGFRVERVAGVDRYATAAHAALAAFPAGSDAVVLARGDAFADALAGAYLAGQLGAPVLLTTPTELPEVTASAIDALGATDIYLLGGSAAISDDVESGFGDEFSVSRLGGTNRYGTAAAVADAAGDDIGTLGDARTAIVVSGAAFPDAVSAGPIAFGGRFPLLLTPPTALAPETADALEKLALDRILVVGGPAAVSDAVVTSLRQLVPTVQRLAGATRYATATTIADWALQNLGWRATAVDIASGESFPDALAAGPAAGRARRPLLLTTTAALHDAPRAWLTARAATLRLGRIFGGTAAVSAATAAAVEAAGSGATTGATAVDGQLTSIDPAVARYTVVPSGATTATTVTYRETDVFTLAGAETDLAGFEEAATPADRVRYVAPTATQPARHELTDVDPATITSGTVGNVDLAAEELDLVHPVTGDALRAGISFAGGSFRIDGSSASASDFGADVNEGDSLQIVGTSFRLTNQQVTGSVRDIQRPDPISGQLQPQVAFRVGALGDDHTGPADERYVARGGSGSTDVYEVDGRSADHATFSQQLTEGDEVTYSRRLGAQTFKLLNQPPTTIEGQAVDDLDPDGDTSPFSTAGGSFTIATDDGAEAVSYGGTGVFIVDGAEVDEATFEAAYSAGDDVTFAAADDNAGTRQRITLRNLPLAGGVDPESVNTADQAFPGSAPANSYAVLALKGSTQLQVQRYADGDSLFVDGAPATVEEWEAALTAIADGERNGWVVVESVERDDTTVVQHRLTTRPAG